ncbi:MAG: hypothetical protein KAS93_05005 [Gammaproteobacteria bacterium]|nr:hypothetical protein [Gammaproteobacteria bacterium]
MGRLYLRFGLVFFISMFVFSAYASDVSIDVGIIHKAEKIFATTDSTSITGNKKVISYKVHECAWDSVNHACLPNSKKAVGGITVTTATNYAQDKKNAFCDLAPKIKDFPDNHIYAKKIKNLIELNKDALCSGGADLGGL